MEYTPPKLTLLQKNHTQKVCDKFLYNGKAVDNTQLHALKKVSINVITATEEI